ncbi:hypothetical protein C8A00DRAFT_47524 [Chaetomidium leptoderma]|uniref:Rhodopsin domain-containing protein n=1 Tax=Chaetomidium leptoderma TaxID=669021 RepID=A0AAN6VCT1_9PEZI|nr:hypothetical protein C8A00DRAFT_47524 [Chaetomidium leptoderma]
MTSDSGKGSGFNKLPPSTDFGPQINFTLWLLTALSSAFLALRVYCKFLRHRGLWWDDYLLIGSWLALVANCAFVSANVNLGFGRPLTQFNFQNLETFLLFSNLSGSFSILAALWSKTSFAVTVLRISSGWMKPLVWFIIITVNACLGVAIVITWAQCTPIEKVWRPQLEGYCWPKGIQIHYNIFTAIYSGVMDIVLAIMPWKIIWALTMNRKEKIGVMVAMSMGIFAGITSLIKITQLPSISNSTFTESTTQLVILGAAESAITIIAASIPILRALIRDSRPPPGPAEFYHTLDFSLYTGTVNSQGTGRSSTVITGGRPSHRHRTSTSTNSSGWNFSNKEHQQGGGSISSSAGRLSGLSRFSGLSIMVLGRRSSSIMERSETDTAGDGSRRESLTVEFPPPPPPGRILQTEEVVVEYEERVGQGQDPGQGQWVAIGRAV